MRRTTSGQPVQTACAALQDLDSQLDTSPTGHRAAEATMSLVKSENLPLATG